MNDKKTQLVSRLFDIRNIVGLLMLVYGVILLVGGLAPSAATAGAIGRRHSADPIDMSVGSSANIWVGVILLAVAVVFIAWAAWRPTKMEQPQEN